MPRHPPTEFVRTFRFSPTVPRWRAHYFAEDGTLVFDMRESDVMPPLNAWATCVLPLADMARLAGGVEIDDHG